MKKIVLCVFVLLALGAATARADELPNRPPSIVAYTSPQSVVPELWTGIYLGINGGFAWNSASVYYQPNDPAASTGVTAAGITPMPSASYHVNGPLGGGQVGYNLQIMNWLLGVEADYQWSDFKGTGTSLFSLRTSAASTTRVAVSSLVIKETMDPFGTVRARFGFVPANPLMIYGTGGLAYGHIQENFSGMSPVGRSDHSGRFFVQLHRWCDLLRRFDIEDGVWLDAGIWWRVPDHRQYFVPGRISLCEFSLLPKGLSSRKIRQRGHSRLPSRPVWAHRDSISCAPA